MTEISVFRKMIEETWLKENFHFFRDMEVRIKPESLRHIAYGTFLHIFSLRFVGDIFSHLVLYHLNVIQYLEHFNKYKLTKFMLSLPDKPPIRGNTITPVMDNYAKSSTVYPLDD